MIPRSISAKLLEWATQYPVVTVTGPRQSGKSTLCRALFSEKDYVSLESIENRRFATEDPKGFLAQFPNGAIIDEIQRAGDLSSYIQGIVDEKDAAGQFILTGSQQFELMSGVSQSLAGRTAIARLLPFSIQEIADRADGLGLDELLCMGFFPRIHDKGLNPTEALSFYFSTYIERDLRQILGVKDLAKFDRFVRLLAGRSGQVLNSSALSNDAGVSHTTISQWMSVLEQSGLLYLLQPYSANIGKRLTKSPKPYFTDSGLHCFLLGIRTPAQLTTHPLRGSVFEGMVITDILKHHFNKGLAEQLSFYRDHRGSEVDLLVEHGSRNLLVEIRSAMTFHKDFTQTLRSILSFLPGTWEQFVVMGNSEKPRKFLDTNILSYRDVEQLV